MISNLVSKCSVFFMLLSLPLNASETHAPKTNVSGDLLVWFASEETATIWSTVLNTDLTNTGIVDTFRAKNLTFDWDLGFRVGIGHQFNYDDWDMQCAWTWYRTQTKGNIPRRDHTVLSEFFAGFVVDQDIALAGKVAWNILYNMFDVELGRKFLPSNSLSLRPFLGLKGGWIDQSIRSSWENLITDNVVTNLPSTENLKNNFWGVGPSAGLQTVWIVSQTRAKSISLFGDFSSAMLWGTWICVDKYHNPSPRVISVNLKNATLGALMLSGFMGIGWDIGFQEGKYCISTKLGYEMQYWENQLRIPTFQLLRLHGDLTLQGGRLQCQFDF